MFQVARIELESSGIGHLAGSGQADLLDALWREISKPSKPFLTNAVEPGEFRTEQGRERERERNRVGTTYF